MKKSLLVIFSSIFWAAPLALFAQSCTLLPGWNPGTLADGKSITGYSLREATYTTSCNQARGILTCTHGSLGSVANIYKYQTCTPHTWANCVSPTKANHLERKTLYSGNTATHYQSCSQMGKLFQCINGKFTGEKVATYGFSVCQEKSWRPCIDIWTNSFVNHLDSIYGYTAKQSTTEKSCQQLESRLTCLDETRSGPVPQNQLFENCKEMDILSCNFTGANNTRVTIPHDKTQIFYSSERSPYPKTCADVSQTLACTNGDLEGNSSLYPYAQCVNGTQQDCVLNGGNGQTIVIAQGTNKQLFAKGSTTYPTPCTPQSVSCTNGKLSNYNYIFPTCIAGTQEDAPPTPKPQVCIFKFSDESTTTTLVGNTPMTGYRAKKAVYPKTCTDYAISLTCATDGTVPNKDTYQYKNCENTGGLTTGIDVVLSIGIPGAGSKLTGIVAQYSAPTLNIILTNRGTEPIDTMLNPGVLSCIWKTDAGKEVNIYKNNTIDRFTLNPGTSLKTPIVLSDIFTQSLGVKNVYCSFDVGVASIQDKKTGNESRAGTLEVTKASRFDIAMSRAIDPIRDNLDAPEGFNPGKSGADMVNDYLMRKVMDILVPLVVVVGILSSLLGLYKLLFSSDDKAIGEGTNYLVYGLLGIVVIMSANFIASSLYTILASGNAGFDGIQGVDIARNVYEKIAFPFIKLIMYLALGVLFIILASRVITFIFGSDEDTQKHAGTIIGWNVIGMLVIIGAKQLIEAVYGKYDKVVQNVSNLGQIGSGILADKNIPLLYHIINWAMGLASLVILIMVLVQAFQLLTKPDDEKAMGKIKNSLLYIFIGIMVIGVGYIITNFLIVN